MKKKSTLESEWFQPKHYLHFDNRLTTKDYQHVLSLVTNPTYVKSHSFYPFIRFYKTKYKTQKKDDGTKYLDKKGKRDLCFASHLDSQIYSYYSHLLSEKYEKKLAKHGLSENIIAFRELKTPTGEAKCNIHLAKEAFEVIKNLGNCSAYAFDITKFFDTLKREHLKTAWCAVIDKEVLPDDHYNIFKYITKHAVVDKDKLDEIFKIPKSKKLQPARVCSPAEFRDIIRPYQETLPDGTFKKILHNKPLGIPQGSPISATLANIYMFSFDLRVNELMKKLEGKYFRYCDDILCIIPSEKKHSIQKFIEEELASIALAINVAKSDNAHFYMEGNKVTSKKGIQYLGFIFDGVNVAIRAQSISRFRRNAKRRIKYAKLSHEKINIIKSRHSESLVPLRRKKLISSLTHHGTSNFISYGHRAAKIMDSQSIKNQMKKMDKYIFGQI